MKKLLLGSSSPYRRVLLQRLGLTFECANPAINETAHPSETAEALVRRLSFEKAQALADSHPNHLIIGSDQIASLDDEMLTKPGTRENALTQLRACSGRTVTFFTGVCVYQSSTGESEVCVTSTEVRFRELSEQQIENYIRKEQPLDCAGSFKCEGLGISLFASVSSNDPTALVGLPLIQLTRLLSNAGLDPLN
jgi:septum formation protein